LHTNSTTGGKGGSLGKQGSGYYYQRARDGGKEGEGGGFYHGGGRLFGNGWTVYIRHTPTAMIFSLWVSQRWAYPFFGFYYHVFFLACFSSCFAPVLIIILNLDGCQNSRSRSVHVYHHLSCPFFLRRKKESVGNMVDIIYGLLVVFAGASFYELSYVRVRVFAGLVFCLLPILRFLLYV